MISVLINKTKKEDSYKPQIKDLIKQFVGLPDGMYELAVKKPARTSKQNRALHVFFEMIAEILNEKHLYFTRDFYKNKDFEIEWSSAMVKELIWRPVQKAMYNKDSTTRLTTSELSKVAEIIQANFATKGIDIQFPSIEYINDK